MRCPLDRFSRCIYIKPSWKRTKQRGNKLGHATNLKCAQATNLFPLSLSNCEHLSSVADAPNALLLETASVRLSAQCGHHLNEMKIWGGEWKNIYNCRSAIKVRIWEIVVKVCRLSAGKCSFTAQNDTLYKVIRTYIISGHWGTRSSLINTPITRKPFLSIIPDHIHPFGHI